MAEEGRETANYLTVTELTKAVEDGYVKRNGDDRMDVPLTLAASEVIHIAKNITRDRAQYKAVFDLLVAIAKKSDKEAAKVVETMLSDPKFRHLS